MSKLDELQADVAALPEESQRMIVELVSFLKQRHQSYSVNASTQISFEDQPFVGMWSDRTELQDSSTWVRQIRQQQWQR